MTMIDFGTSNVTVWSLFFAWAIFKNFFVMGDIVAVSASKTAVISLSLTVLLLPICKYILVMSPGG